MLRHWQAASSQQTRMDRQRLWSTLTLNRSNSFSWHELKVKIVASWRIDLVCSEAEVSYMHVKLFYLCFFILWLRQSFFTSIVHSGMRIACCYWFLVDLIIRTLIYSLQSIKARLWCRMIVFLLANFFFMWHRWCRISAQRWYYHHLMNTGHYDWEVSD